MALLLSICLMMKKVLTTVAMLPIALFVWNQWWEYKWHSILNAGK
jgi:hypothetical protein